MMARGGQRGGAKGTMCCRCGISQSHSADHIGGVASILSGV